MANMSSNIQKINSDTAGSDSVKRTILRQIKGQIQRTRFDAMLDTRYLFLHICQNLKTHHNYHCTLGAWPVAGQFSHFHVVAPR